jgi:3-hydroxyisobutyrate dehydrogenase-like beta-hydroxyacid dehydrogenase
MKIAFIGLGKMGYLIAGRIQQAGHEVTVFNRNIHIAQKWSQEYRGQFADSPAKAVMGCSIVAACVNNDDAIREVTLGLHGAFSNMESNSIYIDHTTASTTIAKELDSYANTHGFHYLDAPVSGGKPGAAKGTLTVMVGGNENALALATPILETYSKSIHYVGMSGAGQITKSANQICIAGIMQSLGEALALIEHSKLDPEKILNVLLGGSGRSWQMENRGMDMLHEKYDFGFSVDMLAKDIGLALESAQKLNLELPGTKVVNRSYQELMKLGFSDEDISAIMRLFK